MWSYFKITMWAVIWLVTWILIAPWRKGRHNCLTWAIKKHQEEGGYLVIRWCRTNRSKGLAWPHFLWMSDEHKDNLQHCIPKDNEHSEKHLPHPWFDSKVVKGDEGDEN